MAGLLLVGITGALVLGAHRVLAWDRAGSGTVALAMGAVLAVALLRRLRASRSGAGKPGPTGPSSVLRRDGASTKGDARRHRRFVPSRRATVLHMRDGRRIAARITDVSIAGVAIEARLTDAEFLSVARVGAHGAGPVRRTPTGAVFGFDTLLDPQFLDASFVL